MIRTLAALLLAAVTLTVASAPTRAQTLSAMPPPPGGSFSPAQRQEIVDILRQALKTDPSILRDAIAALQADDGNREAAAAQAAIAGNEAALTRTVGDPIAGNPNGDVTVVEFYDVRCPYCRRMLPVLDTLLQRDPGIRLVYKDIPVLGPGSVIAAKAVLAAQRQGAYQKLHDLLMAGTPNIDLDVVHAAASRLGLDWDRLRRDMNDPAIQARIDANLRLASALKIEGTPTYVIGGEMLPGAIELAELEDAVAAARRQ